MDRIKMYIDGSWVSADSGRYRKIINPANGEAVAEMTEGTAEDVRKAVAGAKKAFAPDSPWRQLLPEERAALLLKTADLIDERAEELAVAETNSMGRVYKETRYDDVYAVSGAFRYYAGIIHELKGEATAENGDLISLTIREPLGVCAVIAPWNYSIGTMAAGLAPALAAGNTVVVKPSSLTPVSTAMVFEAMEEAGFPAGSVNLVLGPGDEIGTELAENEDVAKITFTGSTATGQKIIENSGKGLKRCALELGGKSPFIIFDDADLDAAVDRLMFGIFLSQGQVCVAGSRLLVQESAYEQVTSMLKERIPKIRIGMPLDPETEFGPLVSEGQLETVLRYIESGKEEGAELLIGGNRIVDGDFAKGCFVEPTVFVKCTPEMRIVKEEIFGPVLTVQTFKEEKEAIALANSTRYGLAGAVFTSDLGRALRVSNQVDTGMLWVNTYMENSPSIPVSPHGNSGLCLDGGMAGLEEYTVLKQINLKMQPSRTGWFAGIEEM